MVSYRIRTFGVCCIWSTILVYATCFIWYIDVALIQTLKLLVKSNTIIQDKVDIKEAK